MFPVMTFAVLVPVMFFCRAQPQLIGPPGPVVALVGGSIILPCQTQKVDKEMSGVEWRREDLDPIFVYVWNKDAKAQKEQHPAYKGRTLLFKDQFIQGTFSLKIFEVKLSDEGTYKCFVPTLNRILKVHLVVGAVSSPVISLSGMDRDRGGVVLQCESAGWYPEPEVLWLDAEGNLLSAGPPETVRGPDDLYTVSSRVTVDKRHSNSFTCRVQQKDINQTREDHIHVLDDFFLSSSSSAVPIITGLAVSLAVSIMVILACVFFVWRQNTTKTKKRSRDEAERGEKLLTEETVKMKVLEETKDANELKEEKKKLEEELETRNKELKEIKDESSSSSDSLQLTSGDITVEVDQRGRYICLTNTSDQDKSLGGRQLKLQINNEEPITYTFDESKEVKPGETVTLFHPVCGTIIPLTADLKKLPWTPGDKLQVISDLPAEKVSGNT